MRSLLRSRDPGLMFNLYIQESLKDLRYEHKGGIRVNRVLVPVLCFVNDTAILVGNEENIIH